MEETRGIIRRGCILARELEENLENVANQPEILSRYCDEIVGVFSHVKNRISHANRELDDQFQLLNQADQVLQAQAAVQFFGSSSSGGAIGGGGVPTNDVVLAADQETVRDHDAAEFSMRFGDEELQAAAMEVSGGNANANAGRGGSSSSSSQRRRRRYEISHS